MGSYVTLNVGPKNRVVLPLALRRAAGLGVGTELRGYVDVQGRVILETVDAVRARVWAAAPHAGQESASAVRAAHETELSIERENAARRAAGAVDDQAGARLLAELGL
jgi:bifunctional DNA-binding transcriptional regulator/antitoxin component of YhaV-PrlF toxin-antitoxin module